MKLCATAVFLMVLTWTRADPVPNPEPEPEAKAEVEECQKFEIINDKTQVMGRHHFLVGFANTTFARSVLGAIPSVWANITGTETGLKVTEFKKMNGTCTKMDFDMTTNGDRAKAQMFGMTTDIQLLKFNDSVILMDLKGYIESVKSLSKDLHLDPKHYDDHDHGEHEDISLTVHQMFLLGRESDVSEFDLQRFKAHAKCVGFTGEPDFHHKSDQVYCTEEESVMIE